MDKNQLKRLTLSVIAGFLISAILFTTLITFGYSSAYGSGIEKYDVTLFGLPIFSLTLEGAEYVGRTVMSNMSFFGAGFGIFSAVITEFLHVYKMKHQAKKKS